MVGGGAAGSKALKHAPLPQTAKHASKPHLEKSRAEKHEERYAQLNVEGAARPRQYFGLQTLRSRRTIGNPLETPRWTARCPAEPRPQQTVCQVQTQGRRRTRHPAKRYGITFVELRTVQNQKLDLLSIAPHRRPVTGVRSLQFLLRRRLQGPKDRATAPALNPPPHQRRCHCGLQARTSMVAGRRLALHQRPAGKWDRCCPDVRGT